MKNPELALNLWNYAILYFRRWVNDSLTWMDDPLKQRILLMPLFLTDYWIFIRRITLRFIGFLLSRALLDLVLGILLGILLTVMVGAMILCSGRPGREGNLIELKMNGKVSRLKQRKRKASVRKSVSPTSTSETDSITDLLRILNIHEPHKIESCNWLNTIVGQIMLNYLHSSRFQEHAMNLVEELLDQNSRLWKDVTKPRSQQERQYSPSSVFTSIEVTELVFDDAVPTFTNAKISTLSSTSAHDSLIVYIDTSYQGRIKLAVECEVVLNWPKPTFAILPVAISVSLIKLNTTCAIQVKEHYLTLSFLPETFRATLEIQSSLGYRTQIRDLPKIKSMILARVQIFLQQYIMAPNFITIPLPMLKDIGRHHYFNESPTPKKTKHKPMTPTRINTPDSGNLSFVL
jgi:hypothetical protein